MVESIVRKRYLSIHIRPQAEGERPFPGDWQVVRARLSQVFFRARVIPSGRESEPLPRKTFSQPFSVNITAPCILQMLKKLAPRLIQYLVINDGLTYFLH